MARFDYVVFVCTNEGRPGDERPRCGKRGGGELLEQLKASLAARGKRGRIRVMRSGCLDLCARGCAAFVHASIGPKPEAWYIHLKPGDADRLLDEVTGAPPSAAADAQAPLQTL